MEYEVRVRQECPACHGTGMQPCQMYLDWWNDVQAQMQVDHIGQREAMRLLEYKEHQCDEEYPCKTCKGIGYVEEWMPISHLAHFLQLEMGERR